MAGILEQTPAVLEWMERMAAFGHGQMEKFDAASAIQVAAASTPKSLLVDSTFQDDHGIALGSRVTVTAESFGPEPTEGDLIAATRTHFSLRRHDDVLISAPEISAARVDGALMFRLAEAVNTIVVHDSVKQAIEAAGIDTLTFIDPADWTG